MSQNFKSLMSQLRVSKDENVSKVKTKVKEKVLKLSKNHKYIVRLLPYINVEGKPMTVKENWYHYKDGTKYGCAYPNCPLCGNTKKTLQRLVNVQLKKSTDQNVFEGEYYILPIHQSLYKLIDDYEKANSLSMFDIFGAPELTIEVESKPSGYGNDILTFDNSTINDIFLPISTEIETYSDDQIMSFLREFTFDLEKEVASLPKYKIVNNNEVENKVIVEKPINQPTSSEPVKKDLGKTLNDIKNNIDLDEDVSINVNKVIEPKAEVKEVKNDEFETKKPVKTTTKTNKNESTDDSTDSYVKDFLDNLDD